MSNKHPLMKLSPDEEVFLRHWMYGEAHYLEGQGPAKRLQLEYRAIPADLATLIAAGIPDPMDQLAAGNGPPPAEPAIWPWATETLRTRVAKARKVLGHRDNVG